MDFALTEDQEMFRTQIRKMIQNSGGTQLARDVILNKNKTVKDIHQQFAELGMTMINIPEEYDGLDLGTLDLVPTFEEIGRAIVPNLLLETSALAVPLIKTYGTVEQKEKYLPEIASGERLFSFAAMEAGNDFSEEGIQVSLEEADGAYKLSGEKVLVPYGATADSFIVLVRTDDGLSLVIIDKNDQVDVVAQDAYDETKQLTKLTFKDVTVDASQIIGQVNAGWSQLQEGLSYFNAALSSIAVGALESVVEMATEYAQIREQFGQAIGRFQAIKHPIVDMKVDLEIARSLSYYANWVLDTSEADRLAATNNARIFASDALLSATDKNIQIHGGIGFTEEIDCHLFLKQARYYQQLLGSTISMREATAQYLEQI